MTVERVPLRFDIWQLKEMNPCWRREELSWGQDYDRLSRYGVQPCYSSHQSSLNLPRHPRLP